jgi:hypothetical protein
MIVRRDGSVPDEQHVKGLKEFARRTIKRFSHRREKEELRQYMDDHVAIGNVLALGMPTSILELISLGIKEFPKKDNKIFRIFIILCDVITIGFLMRFMKTWTKVSTFFENLEKFEQFRHLPFLSPSVQMGRRFGEEPA